MITDKSVDEALTAMEPDQEETDVKVFSDPNVDYKNPPHIEKWLAKLDDPATAQIHRRIQDHCAEVDKLTRAKDYWASRLDATASDAAIKEAKLEPIQNRLDELAAEQKIMQDDEYDDGQRQDSPLPSPIPIENWRMRIQAEAYEQWIQLRALGCNPSVHSMCDAMAKWCVKTNICQKYGQNPAAGTIRNTVLGAGHWTPPPHSVEQAKEHIARLAQVAQPQPVSDGN